MKKAIVIKKGDINDHRIKIKIRDSGFKVVRDDIPGLKCDLVGGNTSNATLTVMHKPPTQTPYPCTSELHIHVHVHMHSN